ncbi:hypothetical protein OAO87_00795 [bacterium]|nr:hypothetical protein [bacterium]
MEAATALAPALGVDMGALVGRSLHEQRVEATTRVQTAWREKRAYRRHFVTLWCSRNFGRQLSYEQRAREKHCIARVLGGRISAMDTEGVLIAAGNIIGMPPNAHHFMQAAMHGAFLW